MATSSNGTDHQPSVPATDPDCSLEVDIEPAPLQPDVHHGSEELHLACRDDHKRVREGESDNGMEDSPDFKRMKLSDIAASKKVNSEQWDSMFERLVAYKEEHGDCLVPKRYSADPKLGTWVETQRVQYKRLERQVDQSSGRETLTPNKRLDQKRLAKLESIGFAWTAKGRKPKPAPTVEIVKEKKVPSLEEKLARNRLNDNQWEQMFQKLVQYKEKYGDTLVPRKYEADPKLATWVETQRVLWNRDYRETSEGNMEPNMTDERKLDSYQKAELALPDPAVVPRHDMMVGAVKVETWVDCLPKQPLGGATVEDAAELAATMGDEHLQGVDYAQSAAVVEAAEAVAAEAVDASMDDSYHSAIEDQVDDMVHDSKILAQPKRLTKERKEKLDSIGFVWSLRSKRIDDHWDEMFRQLVQYKQKHGDCLVPSRYEENLKLGKWVETQRYEYTKLQRSQHEVDDFNDTSGSGKPRATNPRLTEERLRRLESIGFEWKVKHKMKRYYDKQWDQMFERLLQFKAETGHCMVPKRYPPDMKLGTWVHTQRIQYRKFVSGGKGSAASDQESNYRSEEEVSYRLTDDRRKRLEEVGFVWSARENDKLSEQGRITRNSYDDQWDSMFARLKEFKEKHGHCLVPKRFKEDAKLGTWVDTQRVQYKKMKKKLAEQGIDYSGPPQDDSSTEGASSSGVTNKPIIGRLTDERIRRLEDLGFVWSLRDDWQKHYDELAEYKREHGHCNVPARYSKNRRLGIWVSAQRQQYKILMSQDQAKIKRSAPLTQDRIELLNSIGFTWTIRSRDSLGESWNQRFQDLQEYKATHGDCNVPSRYPENPELGVWVGTQRTQYRLYMKAKETGQTLTGASAMSDYRIRQLEELGFQWTLRGFDVKAEMPDHVDDDDVLDHEPLPVAGEMSNVEHESEGVERDVADHRLLSIESI